MTAENLIQEIGEYQKLLSLSYNEATGNKEEVSIFINIKLCIFYMFLLYMFLGGAALKIFMQTHN